MPDRLVVTIVHSDRSPVRRRFPATEAGLRAAQIVTISQSRFANVRGTILEDGGGKHVFDRDGNYLFTVPTNPGPVCSPQ